MERREKYKRIIMFCASAFILAAQTGVFAYIWFSYYADGGDRQSVLEKGNYVVIGQYALMLFFFYKLYGDLRLAICGYLMCCTPRFCL